MNWLAASTPERLQMVASGKADLECANTTQTLARLADVDFSNLIFLDGGGLLVRGDSSVAKLADLGGKKIAVLRGTTTETRLRAALQRQLVNATVVPIGDAAEGIALVESGSADAYAGDKVKLIGLVAQAKDPTKFRMPAEDLSFEPYAMALPRNDSALRLEVNRRADAGVRERRDRPDLRRSGSASSASRPACSPRCTCSTRSRNSWPRVDLRRTGAGANTATANSRRIGWLVALTVLCIVAALVAPALPQPGAYHAFADQRGAFGIPNFSDVVSNAGFLIAGLAGLAIVLGGRTRFEFASERWPWIVFFAGLVLTAFGSAYYHLAPDNARLFWDRLPITIALMALLSSQIVERIGVRVGVALLVPMLVIGAATVVYWRATELAGAGNLMPYVILQGYTVLIMLWLALALPSRYTRGADILWIFGWYVLAKVFETLDAQVFAIGNVVSGHTLKHRRGGDVGLRRVRDARAADARRARAVAPDRFSRLAPPIG